jgi:PPM family protein phosphatase
MHKVAEIEFADLSDIGCERDQNEDSYAYWEPQSADGIDKGRLAVIADGMGGYEGGQEASRIAVQTVCAIYASTSIPDHQLALLESVRAAHDRIQEYAAQHPDLFGMGTTCTAACIANGLLHYVHVGDSRLYLLRNDTISQLTNDHSYVARLVKSGALSAEEAETHPQRHILTAALGIGDEPVFETPAAPLKLEPGDALLLCTDGLWGTVSGQEMRDLANRGTVSDACRELVHLAKERGSPDNITVQLLRISQNGSPSIESSGRVD